MKRQDTNCEKIFVIHISNKGFVAQHVKENSSNSLIIRQAANLWKWGEYSRHFTEDIQVDDKHYEERFNITNHQKNAY